MHTGNELSKPSDPHRAEFHILSTNPSLFAFFSLEKKRRERFYFLKCPLSTAPAGRVMHIGVWKVLSIVSQGMIYILSFFLSLKDVCAVLLTKHWHSLASRGSLEGPHSLSRYTP